MSTRYAGGNRGVHGEEIPVEDDQDLSVVNTADVPAKDDADTTEVVTLTKKQLSEIVKARLGRQKTSITAQYADYDQVKTRNAELEAANETAQEKAVREAREAAAAEVPVKVSEATSAASRALIKSEIKALAVQAGFKYPQDVETLLLADPSIKVNDKFEVTGVQALVDKLKTDRPEWLAGSRLPFNGAPPRGNGTTPPPADLDPESPEGQAYLNNRKANRRRIVGVSSVL